MEFTFVTFAFLLVASLVGAFFYRIRGGLFKGAPHWFGRGLYVVGLTIPAYLFLSWWVTILVFAGTYLTVALGHGDWIDMGHSTNSDPGEWLNRIVNFFVKNPTSWLHDAVGMTLSGLFMTLPLGIAMAFICPFMGLLFALSGVPKVFAYIIGWIIFDRWGNIGPKHFKAGVEISEFLTGAFQYGVLAILVFLMF